MAVGNASTATGVSRVRGKLQAAARGPRLPGPAPVSGDRVPRVIAPSPPDRLPITTAAVASLVLQNDDVVSGLAGKQRPDQLRSHGLVALRTLIPLQAIGECMWRRRP